MPITKPKSDGKAPVDPLAAASAVDTAAADSDTPAAADSATTAAATTGTTAAAATGTTAAVVKPAETAVATKTKYDDLPDRLRKINDAMEGLCKVLYGDGFKHDDIWGEKPKVKDTEISKYLAALPLTADIKSTLEKVKEGINQVPPLKAAVDKIMEGMGQVADVIAKGKVEIGKAQDMVQPIMDFSQKLLPTVAEIVKAATDKDITSEINASLDFIRGAAAVTTLGFFAEGILSSLGTHMQAA